MLRPYLLLSFQALALGNSNLNQRVDSAQRPGHENPFSRLRRSIEIPEIGRTPMVTMSDTRSLLALGGFSHSEQGLLAQIAEQSSCAFHYEDEPYGASTWLDEHGADVLLLDDSQPSAESFALERRAESRWSGLPVLTWSASVGDLGFAEAFSWGADDVVTRGAAFPLRTRLRHLSKIVTEVPEATRGIALIADPDRTRRIVMGRVLRNAGYSVTFAVRPEDLRDFLLTSEVAVVVASTELVTDPSELIESTRRGNTHPLWIVACPPRDLPEQQAKLSLLGQATVTDSFAPVENVLFVANELLRRQGPDNRASPRLLYGTTVAFRGAGRDLDDFGYTYNISEGGIYVRTLAPPEDEFAWVELRPPRSERRLRLVGRIAWRRGLGRGEFATVPPGFGMEIVDGAERDLALWKACYKAYAEGQS